MSNVTTHTVSAGHYGLWLSACLALLLSFLLINPAQAGHRYYGHCGYHHMCTVKHVHHVKHVHYKCHRCMHHRCMYYKCGYHRHCKSHCHSRVDRFDYPGVNGYRVDWCLSLGKDCGAAAAHHYCKARGYSHAKSWRKDSDVGTTMTVGTHQVCCNKGCDSFRWIKCVR